MTDVSQVVAQMSLHKLPPLPSGHPILDGKYKRFGPQKKAWYILREVALKSGKRVVTGAFGIFQGENRNTVPVSMDSDSLSDEDRAEFVRQQEAYAAKEAEAKKLAADLAANRAKDQWSKATANNADAHPYLTRKQVTAENARVDDKGTLLIPMARSTPGGRRLAGLQKIDAEGNKKYNSGMDKIGVACNLGSLADAPVIAIGEGYATCRSVRMVTGLAYELPVVVAFDAGNIIHVAQALRKAHPQAHLLFLADDDYQLVKRFTLRLREDFNVSVAVPIDGVTHTVLADNGEQVRVFAEWRTDAQGVDYIDADIRAGLLMRTYTYENAGVSRCRAAAKAVGNASVVIPQFAARGDNKWTDFNDLHVEQSLDAVSEQIRYAVEAALSPSESPAPSLEASQAADSEYLPAYLDHVPLDESPHPFSEEPEQAVDEVPTGDALLFRYSLIYGTTEIWDGLAKRVLKRSAFDAFVGKKVAKEWFDNPKKKLIQKAALPTIVRGAAVDGGMGGGRLQEMLENLTLLRGTETVWDMIGRQVMTLGAVRANYTTELTTKWQERVDRKTIEQKNLVFDPTQTVDLTTHENIFFGWPLTPKENISLVDPIIALMQSLCASEDNAAEVLDFVLCWMALPLQRPGAKLQTALLVFGEKQGTGKSLLFDSILRPIYGEYGTTVGQHQLESGFTDWRSRKLFTLFEEVLSRDDKFSHNGTLKYMITGKRMQVNPKNLPLREEHNHMNCAFLSNEPQPIPIELEDRRFCVIHARIIQARSFYDAVVHSINNGGIEAFYHYLLNYPLRDFNEHTKPPMTRAKERVIAFGRPSWDAFYVSWKEGYLDAPYCSCLTSDLYIIYKRWCDRNGEKAITQTKFSGLVDTRETKSKKDIALGSKMKKSYMVFVIDSPTGASLHEQCTRFRKEADVNGLGN